MGVIFIVVLGIGVSIVMISVIDVVLLCFFFYECVEEFVILWSIFLEYGFEVVGLLVFDYFDWKECMCIFVGMFCFVMVLFNLLFGD